MNIKLRRLLVLGILSFQLLMPKYDASVLEGIPVFETIETKGKTLAVQSHVRSAAPTDLVVFDDAGLEASVATQLGVPVGEITVEDMSRLTEFTYTDARLDDLTGLEYAINLTKLDLSENNLSYISELSTLTKLEDLNLSWNMLNNRFSPIENITSLKTLNISNNAMSRLSSFSGLVNLTNLDASSNLIKDMTGIENLTNLKTLNLGSNVIVDITLLTDLTNLEKLDLNINKVSDVSPLTNLLKLTDLNLDHNQILDLSPLETIVTGDTLINSSATNQVVTLEDMTVETNEPIRSSFTDVEGTSVPFVLGIPELGVNRFSVSSSEYTFNTLKYSVLVSQKITCNSVDYEFIRETDEGARLSEQDLISLFGLLSYSSNWYMIDQSAVNYNVPATYDLEISDADMGRKTPAKLVVRDLLPVINIATNPITIEVGSTPLNIMDAFGITATEITPGDLTSAVVVDDSAINYDKVGTYNIPLSVEDNEGNPAFETATLIITGPELNIKDTASTTEETALTDTQLIALFEAENSADEPITVDQSAVNYHTPGDYEVVFSIPSGAEQTGTLTVTDVLPAISITEKTPTLDIGSPRPNIITDYGVVATEIIRGDLTADVNVDDSAVDYDTAGTYEILLTVFDEEGNKAEDKINITIVDKLITGLEKASTDEETALSDTQLINLFEVVSKDSVAITVDQSAVNYHTPGDYEVVFSIPSGEEHRATLTVTDVLPIITVTTDTNSIELGSAKPDFITAYGVVATEITRGDLTADINVDDSAVDYDTAGTYEILLTVFDEEGNKAEEKIKLTINEKPLTGLDAASTNEETALTDTQLINLFEVVSKDSVAITVDQSAVNYHTPGDYEVVFSIPSGEEHRATLTVTDLLPVITVTNDTNTIELGSAKPDFITAYGVVATEITNGDLTADVNVDDSAVDYDTIGTYEILLTVFDEEGNRAEAKIKLTIDDKPISGLEKSTTNEETALTDAQLVTLFEVESKDGGSITVDQSAVNYHTPGDYDVVFSNASGDTLNSTLTIIDLFPVIHVANYTNSIEAGSAKPDLMTIYGVSATEIIDGDLTADITIDDSAVDYSKAGIYDIVFTVFDEEGNKDEKTVGITVSKQPISGLDTANTNEETPLTDEQLIALFEIDTKDSVDVTVDQSAVDYHTPGEYPVIFSIASGEEVNSILNIVDMLPIITATTNELEFEIGSDKPDFVTTYGLEATEITKGDLTADLIIDDSEVDYNTAGNYQVYITVFDEEGNKDEYIIRVHISTLEEIPTSEGGNEVISDVPNVEIGSENNSGDIDTNGTNSEAESGSDTTNTKMTDDNEKMLTTTGRISVLLILILTAIVGGLVSIKSINSQKEN